MPRTAPPPPPIATIARHMTSSPATIEASRSLAEAHRTMRRHGIRHLPVVAGGSLVGILSLRDLHLLETLRDVDPEKVSVDEAMTRSPYTVEPGASVETVARTLAENKWGSAVVVDDGKVVGMFTTTDALKLLGRLLRNERLRAARVRRLRRKRAGLSE
ncbi:MAG TPA: CBS domain-containing protein [Thermoanaerobaculia bacterium]|nr:CBS domain-containing protein [Thermoanaerobaculia bacterium]HQR67687.1 CBS domain-containing protein [Thermoanaerobaculia bacterium]